MNAVRLAATAAADFDRQATGPCTVVNIADSLSRIANERPDKAAIRMAAGGGTGPSQRPLTFRELAAEVDAYCHGFTRHGLERGMRVLLFVPPGVEFFALTFALFKIGAVPVLIDPGLGANQMGRCLERVPVDAFIGVPRAHVFRLLYSGAFRGVRLKVTVGQRWFWGGLVLDQLRATDRREFQSASTRAEDPAAVLFTSGSTGPAKGVVYTHGAFAAQLGYLRSHFGYGPDEIDLPTFPLFALFDAALGMTAVLPSMDFSRPGRVDPDAILRPLQQHGCTHMFGSPALLDRVARHAIAAGVSLPRLKRVITAGAPVRPDILERFARLLPEEAEIFTPYGATEALPVASIGHREILNETAARTRDGRGTCVGRSMTGLQVRIIEIHDEPIREMSQARELATGGVGEIIVRGPNVTREYANRPDLTALAKILEPDGSVWHRMGDAGYIDADGRLWFCGRKSQRVLTAAGTMFTECVEGVFNAHAHVRRSALVGVGVAGAMEPVLCVEPAPMLTRSQRRALPAALLETAQMRPELRHIRRVLLHDDFPVDVRHNAKIFREKLALWAAGRAR